MEFLKKAEKKERKQISVFLKLEVHCTQARENFFEENILKLDCSDSYITA